MGVSRRQVLAGLGAAAGAAAIGACGSDGAAGDDDVIDPDAGSFPPDARIEPDAEPITACTATSTLTPEQLLAHIDTIVVLCMENRSFDHYLGSLRMIEGRMDIDGLTGTEMNLSASGTPVPVHLLEDFTPADPPHGWDAVHAQWNNGLNDGFVTEHEGASETDVMGYHVRSQLPVTYALADASAICQKWFCSVLGPTWPNRFYLHGATSNGNTGNFPAFGFTSIFDRLADADIDALNYYSDVAWATGGYGKLGGLASIERFFEDAMIGALPPFSIVDPSFFGGGANDDHPDHDITMGQALIGSVVAALGASPQWNRSLIVVTYDEHGGFYDHVAPPTTIDEEKDFRQLGFRVPSLVVGPTVRRGCAIDTVLEHSSVVSTASKRWQLEPLNERAAAAGDLSVCIDPRLIDAPLPAPVLPSVSISRRALRDRQARYRAAGIVSHRELSNAIDARRPPSALDRRGDADAIAHRVLAWGERLGAVTIKD